VKLIVPAFYSTQDTRTPVRVAVLAMLANILLNVIFLFYFFPKLKNGAPALASALAGYFTVFALFVIFRLRFGRLGTREIAASLAKIIVCAGVMGVVCWGALKYSQFDSIAHFLPRLGVFIALIGSATLTYLALAWICAARKSVKSTALRSIPPPTSRRNPSPRDSIMESTIHVFLSYLRVERGLAQNSFLAYGRTRRFAAFLRKRQKERFGRHP
jgi:hypothetical protein